MNKVDRPYTINSVVNLATIKADLKLVSTQIVSMDMYHCEKIQVISQWYDIIYMELLQTWQ